MDYAAFDERVSQATGELECAVHQTVLGSLDIDAPFVRASKLALIEHAMTMETDRSATRFGTCSRALH